jgi:hypothetical protein
MKAHKLFKAVFIIMTAKFNSFPYSANVIGLKEDVRFEGCTDKHSTNMLFVTDMFGNKLHDKLSSMFWNFEVKEKLISQNASEIIATTKTLNISN